MAGSLRARPRDSIRAWMCFVRDDRVLGADAYMRLAARVNESELATLRCAGMAVAEVSPGATPARSRVRTIVVWIVVLLVLGALASLPGWNVRGWLEEVWDTMTTISLASLVSAILVKTLGTTATAFAWYSILRYGYPGEVRWLHVLAAYAASVALNGVLPANLGTLVLLIMLTQLIASASFAGIMGGYGVEKIFFCVIGAVPYLYLFFTVGGSFDLSSASCPPTQLRS